MLTADEKRWYIFYKIKISSYEKMLYKFAKKVLTIVYYNCML